MKNIAHLRATLKQVGVGEAQDLCQWRECRKHKWNTDITEASAKWTPSVSVKHVTQPPGPCDDTPIDVTGAGTGQTGDLHAGQAVPPTSGGLHTPHTRWALYKGHFLVKQLYFYMIHFLFLEQTYFMYLDITVLHSTMDLTLHVLDIIHMERWCF